MSYCGAKHVPLIAVFNLHVSSTLSVVYDKGLGNRAKPVILDLCEISQQETEREREPKSDYISIVAEVRS